MTIERTGEGLEARLSPRGFGRWFSAGFLFVWLCGWLGGECFAIWMLVGGVRAFVTGTLLDGAQPEQPLAMAVLAGLFLLLWLSFWTLGGYAAGREFLRLVSSEDRILVQHGTLVVRRRIGPFRSTRTVPRDEIAGIHAVKTRVIADTKGGALELTTHARGAEVESLVAALREDLGLGAGDSSAALFLPDPWREVIDDEGRTALVRDENQRRARGRFAWGLTAFVAAVSIPVFAAARSNADGLPAAGMLGLLTVALGWSAWRISRTRLEWRIDPGRLILRRRSASGARQLFEAQSLEFVATTDSDGDRWYTLYAVSPGAPPFQAMPRFSDLRWRRKIAREMDDPSMPRRLGAWIARRSSMRLDDRWPSDGKVRR